MNKERCFKSTQQRSAKVPISASVYELVEKLYNIRVKEWEIAIQKIKFN